MVEENQNTGDGSNANDRKNDSGKDGDGNNAPTAGTVGTDGNADKSLDQKTYEERIAELDKRDKAMDDKLKRMETLNDKITAEGRATGGAPPAETAEQTQKKTIIKNFGGCIPGLDKMI